MRSRSVVPWARQQGDECLGCRGYVNLAWQGNKEELQRHLEEKLENRERYIQGLEEYEADKKGSASGRVKRGSVPALEFVKVEKESEVAVTENLGIFWPVPIFKDKFGKAPSKSSLTHVWHKGQWVIGTILDEDQGCPIGTLRLTAKTSTRAVHGKDLTAGGIYREGQAQDAFSVAQQGLTNVGSKRKEVYGQVEYGLSVPKKRKVAADDSDSEDFLAGFGSIVKSMGRDHKKRTKDAGESGDEGGGEALSFAF